MLHYYGSWFTVVLFHYCFCFLHTMFHYNCISTIYIVWIIKNKINIQCTLEKIWEYFQLHGTQMMVTYTSGINKDILYLEILKGYMRLLMESPLARYWRVVASIPIDVISILKFMFRLVVLHPTIWRRNSKLLNYLVSSLKNLQIHCHLPVLMYPGYHGMATGSTE